jgi:ADP-heptose:LPS heptosyltransferase
MKTLVIRPGALGDTILTLPFLETLTKRHPQGSLTFLGTSSYLSLIPPGIESLPVDSVAATWLFENNPHDSLPSNFLFDQAYVILRDPHVVVKNLSMVGVQLIISVDPTPMEGRHVVESIHQRAGLACPQRKAVLRRLAAGERHGVIWVHPGSGGRKKCMPLEFFAALSSLLRTRCNADVMVTASEQDEFLTRSSAWKTWLSHPGTMLLKNRSLSDLCREVGGARLFLGNDSGIGHLAAALGVKSGILFSTTDPVQWAPWVPPDQLEAFDCRNVVPSPVTISERLFDFIKD